MEMKIPASSSKLQWTLDSASLQSDQFKGVNGNIRMKVEALICLSRWVYR